MSVAFSFEPITEKSEDKWSVNEELSNIPSIINKTYYENYLKMHQ